jgi:Formylglycinamide ribonucleotide amidotransferase N-terminal
LTTVDPNTLSSTQPARKAGRHVRMLNSGIHVQVGPRKSFATAWSANAQSICASCGLSKVSWFTTVYSNVLAHGRPAGVGEVLSGVACALMARSVAAQVTRLEMSRRFRLRVSAPISDADAAAFAALVHDRMTEEVSTPA